MTNSHGIETAKKCSHVAFPKHPHLNKRKPCGASLFKKVKISNGSCVLKPKKIYCLQSIKDALSRLLGRPEFFEDCQEWRKREPDAATLSDVYDGQVWKEFKGADGEWFFENPLSYGCSINLDWFQPYDNTQYSVGVLYMSLLNLPPEKRYKEENIIILGIIPGPTEPKKHVNSFLAPIVEELKEFYTGCWVQAGQTHQKFYCRLALLCASCDIPASRKIAGFVSHGGLKGCSRCLKTFPCRTFGEKNDCSGFNREMWGKRDLELHRREAVLHKKAKSHADQKKIEREYGIRYSCLCELPYFDNIRFVVIDPMHNLLLGTTKRMLKI